MQLNNKNIIKIAILLFNCKLHYSHYYASTVQYLVSQT